MNYSEIKNNEKNLGESITQYILENADLAINEHIKLENGFDSTVKEISKENKYLIYNFPNTDVDYAIIYFNDIRSNDYYILLQITEIIRKKKFNFNEINSSYEELSVLEKNYFEKKNAFVKQCEEFINEALERHNNKFFFEFGVICETDIHEERIVLVKKKKDKIIFEDDYEVVYHLHNMSSKDLLNICREIKIIINNEA